MAAANLFSRFVEPGRLCRVNYGPDEGKMCTFVDIIDHRRVIIDGPTTGVKRQQIPTLRLSLTDFKCSIFRGAREKTLKAALASDGTLKKFEATVWGKKLAAKAAKKNLTDFDRFKLMLARKKRSGMLKAEVKKVIKGGKKEVKRMSVGVPEPC